MSDPICPQAEDGRVSLGFLIVDVSRLLRREFNRRVQHLGLTEAQWRTLSYLMKAEGANQAQLAEVLEIQPITLGRILDRLVTAGLVQRRPSPTDRRAMQIYLTPEAQPLMAILREAGEATRAAALATVPEPQQEELRLALERMRGNLASMPMRPRAARQESSNHG